MRGWGAGGKRTSRESNVRHKLIFSASTWSSVSPQTGIRSELKLFAIAISLELASASPNHYPLKTSPSIILDVCCTQLADELYCNGDETLADDGAFSPTTVAKGRQAKSAKACFRFVSSRISERDHEGRFQEGHGRWSLYEE